MALLLHHFILFLIVVTPTGSFFFGRTKVLSPSANVHVDVINHVNSALESHAQEYHHSWRDYLLVLLVLAVVIFCVYRRLLATFARRRPSSTLEAVTTASTTAKY